MLFSLGGSKSGIFSFPVSFWLKLARRDSAYVIPFVGIDVSILLLLFFRVIIWVAGGTVGPNALVTTTPMGTPFTLLPPFFFRMILRWVGLVILRKY